ncbi:hypothetical protein SH1V18_37000 [Vallitalea longa]|uniref:Uncharacterized protein n=1 Tax=Vallitalea longa TaxID=2936439 RepID=A0A9W5YEV1_9FIRM|nr:tetratricopeptide repeat protein [Vallitalea longa]GKX31220.1 hypothetical protein SH1V18_37000 [Vallitalea longa]
MKYITFKVKHVILFIIFITIVYLLVNFNLSKIYYVMGNLNIGNNSNAYYSKLVDEFPRDKESVLGQIKKMENILFDTDGKHIFNRMVVSFQNGGSVVNGSTKVLSEDSIDNINNTYKTLSEYHRDKEYFENYTLYISLVNWYAGYNDSAIDILNNSTMNSRESSVLKNIYLSIMNVELGNFHMASNIIDSSYDEEYEFYWNIVDYYFSLLSGSRESIKIKDEDVIKSRDNKYKVIENIYEDIAYIDNISKSVTDNCLEGKVLYDGEPVKNIMVFLLSMDGMSGQLRSVYGNSLVGVTDENGYYKIENIPNGDYQIGIAASWNRLKGKNIDFTRYKSFKDIRMNGNDTYERDINMYSPIKVDVEELGNNKYKFHVSHNYLDFDYYNIGLAHIDKGLYDIYNSNYYSVKKYKGDNIYFDANEERENYFRLGISSSNGIVHVDKLLDPLYQSGKYYLVIYGEIEDGVHFIDNYGLFSNKPAQYINIEGNKLTKGDELLKEQKFNEAVTEYEKELVDNQQDLHIRKTLAKMYMEEWDSNDEDSNIDHEKALEHLLVINETIQQPEIKEAIGYCYYNLNEYSEAVKYFIESNSLYKIGDCYYFMNDYDKAVDSYKKLVGSNVNDSIVERLICIYLLQNDKKGLVEVSGKFTNDYHYADYTELINEFNKIDESDYVEFYDLINAGHVDEAKGMLEKKDDDLARLYRLIFILLDDGSYTDKMDEFMNIYKEMNDSAIKDYAHNLGYDIVDNYRLYNHSNSDGKMIDEPINDDSINDEPIQD